MYVTSLSIYTYLRRAYPVIPFIPFPFLGCILTYHTNSTEKDLSMPIVQWPIDDISDVPRFFRYKEEPLFFRTVISSGNVFLTVITSGNLFPTVISGGNVFPTVITSGNLFLTVISGGNVFPTVITSRNVFSTVITSGNVFPTVITSRSVWNTLRMYWNK